MNYFSIIEIIIFSTIIYLYLHYKTNIRLKYLYTDNVIVIVCCLLIMKVLSWRFNECYLYWLIINISIIPIIMALVLLLTMLRFWRTPQRKITADTKAIVSPADGKIIYINKVEKGDIPVSIKGKRISKLTELIKTDMLKYPCWHIGINMTPFDVHKNCAPIDGTIILTKHFNGKYLSLKNHDSLTQNERNTIIIKNDLLEVCVVQIASRMVRRIDTYVKSGQAIRKGDWFGMIRFGSQVDVIIPLSCVINVSCNQQVYAGTSTIALKE